MPGKALEPHQASVPLTRLHLFSEMESYLLARLDQWTSEQQQRNTHPRGKAEGPLKALKGRSRLQKLQGLQGKGNCNFGIWVPARVQLKF